jgi:hypothetical protein
MFWRLGPYFGLVALLIAISFAVVGEGNRLTWLALGPLVGLGLGAVAFAVYAVLPPNAEVLKGLLAIAMGTAGPGVLLWSAAKFKSVRARSKGGVTGNERTPSSAGASEA